jgi:pyruvate-ferredoxin/flavodoxin oxidoreductase
MKNDLMKTMDGNSAAAYVGHACNEVCAIYPITPSSVMGEIADAKSAAGEANIWGTIPEVAELQSEGGASAAVHGALASGSLCTTFTASQGLLLMIPNMYKIAAELLPTVFHIAARSIACQALSIFGDHQDVMAARSTGFGLMASGSVQEVMDLGFIATAASLESRIPMLHFFDGFRVSHEINKIFILPKEQMRGMINEKDVIAHRNRALSPDHPMISGTSQNPDVYFQGRETVNPFYLDCPDIIETKMREFAEVTGRKYELFQYFGHPEADRIMIIMGSGAEAAHETVTELIDRGEKIGMIKIRLYRPFSTKHLMAAIPETVQRMVIMDRTKEPGATGEPMYQDIQCAVYESMRDGTAPFKNTPMMIGGRYGLSSKEFTPGMIKAVFDNLGASDPKNHFTIGIDDDLTHSSLIWDDSFINTSADAFQSMFYGLGSDGTVGANKNTIKIIGEATDMYAQGYFVYDSKKAGAQTVSHLRFGKKPIRSSYLCNDAQFLGCHNFSFLEKYDMLSNLRKGGTFLLNSPYSANEVWEKLPEKTQQQIIEKDAKFFVIDAGELAKNLGLGARINTIMQTAFFKISGVLPEEEALALIRDSIEKTYGRKGQKIVQMNLSAVEGALTATHEVDYQGKQVNGYEDPPTVPEHAPEFVKDVLAKIIRKEGDSIKVSQMPCDGQFITATTQYEKRNVATDIPVWLPEHCIQCGLCSFVCPHAAIRTKIYAPENLDNAPSNFKSADARKPYEGMKWTIQIAPEDCTGCGLCMEVCPTKPNALKMAPQIPLRKSEAESWDYFLTLPEMDPEKIRKNSVKGSQLIQPLFEFSGACSGCGETPYVKLLTQLFGDRALISNATGCSSIYGGNLPTTPYCQRKDGLGPAWTNSLFEDCAEIGLGFRLSVDKKREMAESLLKAADVPDTLKDHIVQTDQSTDTGIESQRKHVAELKKRVKDVNPTLYSVADYLVEKSVWCLGGDGWAYDIGYGGLDHVLASGRNVNVLVLDTEVYSNTGGQCSKATPRASTAKFAIAGKSMPKKDLGMLAMTYGTVYVAKIAMGANPAQTVKALVEAESYPGSSIVLAYCPCIAHGIPMNKQLDEQKKAVKSGHWPLFRFDPRRIDDGKNPLQLDSADPTVSMEEYMYGEIRYRALKLAKPERAAKLLKLAQQDVTSRFNLYKQWAAMDYSLGSEDE